MRGVGEGFRPFHGGVDQAATMNAKIVSVSAGATPPEINVRLRGRDMKIVYTEEELTAYMHRVEPELSKDRPVLIDQFLDNATEVDVDCLADGNRTVIGIGRGDSAVRVTNGKPVTVAATIEVNFRLL